MRRRFRENHFQRGPHVRAAEMTGKRIAVAPAESKACDQPKAAVGDAVPIIELVLHNGRDLRLPEGVTPARAVALAEALEGIAR